MLYFISDVGLGLRLFN